MAAGGFPKSDISQWTRSEIRPQTLVGCRILRQLKSLRFSTEEDVGTYSGVFSLRLLLTGQGGAHHGEILREATALAEQGKLRTHLDPQHFTLAEGGAGAHWIECGKVAGKVMADVAR